MSRFHPDDRSSPAMFYRSHEAMMDMLHTYAEIQRSPNPLSRDDLERLVTKHPKYRPLLDADGKLPSERRNWI